MSFSLGPLRRFILLAVACVTALSVSAVSTTEVEARNDSVNRAIAVIMSSGVNEVLDQLTSSNVTVDRAAIGRYISAALAGDSLGFTRDSAGKYVSSVIYSSTPDATPDTLSVASQNAFIDSIAALPGAVLTSSGLVFVVINEGNGNNPSLNDRVDVRYTARLSDKTVFDETGDNPVTFDVNAVVPGFTEALLLMKPAGTYRIIIPARLAYGEQGIPGIIPGNAALDFTVTLDAIHPSN